MPTGNDAVDPDDAAPQAQQDDQARVTSTCLELLIRGLWVRVPPGLPQRNPLRRGTETTAGRR